MQNDQIQAIADELWQARSAASSIEKLSSRFPDLSIENAYAIQLANIERRLNGGAKIVGKKIGLTSLPIQTMLGVNEPDYGILLDDMVAAETDLIDTKKLIYPRIEAELAFILKRDLDEAPHADIASVLDATDVIVPAFEIIDSAIANWKIAIQDTVADNASAAMMVLGQNQLKSTDIKDLTAVHMIFRKNGEVIDEGDSSAVMGHPATAVAWLANKLHEFGIKLKAGEVILSGSLTKAYDAKPGDVFSAEFADVGTVTAKFK
jgi:2-keto-4-pentenoate hydratase